MSDDVFEPYPYAPPAEGDGEAVRDHVILVITERGGQNSFLDPNHVSEPMTEAQALANLEHIAQRRQNSHTLVEDRDNVIQVSERELVIFRASVWSGDRVTRVIAGRKR